MVILAHNKFLDMEKNSYISLYFENHTAAHIDTPAAGKVCLQSKLRRKQNDCIAVTKN